MRTRIAAVALVTSLLLAAGCGGADPTATLHAAADRSIRVRPVKIVAETNGKVVETITVDHANGMLVVLADGGEARQIEETVYYRDPGASEWITGPVPKSRSIVDYGVGPLRLAQSAEEVEHKDGDYVFGGDSLRVTVTLTDGRITRVRQVFTVPVKETRVFRFTEAGEATTVAPPPTENTRVATAEDCTSGRGGPRQLVCASAVADKTVSAQTTTTSSP